MKQRNLSNKALEDEVMDLAHVNFREPIYTESILMGTAFQFLMDQKAPAQLNLLPCFLLF